MTRPAHRRRGSIVSVAALLLCIIGGGACQSASAQAEQYFYAQQSAIDANNVYWVRTYYTGDPFAGDYKSRDTIIQHNLATGAERTIFAARRGGIYGLAAAAGRVTFTLRYESTNERNRRRTTLDRIYAMEEGASAPTRIASFGGVLRGKLALSSWTSLCLGFGYDTGINEAGTISTLEYRNTCNEKNPKDVAVYATYARDGARGVINTGGADLSSTVFHGDRLYSFDHTELESINIADGGLIKSPIKDWIGGVDFEGDRAVAVKAEEDDTSGFVWFDPNTMLPLGRVKAKKGQLLEPSLCASGYATLTGTKRIEVNSFNWLQSLGKPPHVATFYDYSHRRLRSVKLPSKGIDNLDCAGDNLIVVMDGNKAPTIRVIPFG